MLAMVIGAVIIALFVADGALVFYLRNQAIAFGEREAGNLSYALAQQTEKSLQAAHLIVSVVAERIEAAKPSTVEEFEEIAGSAPITTICFSTVAAKRPSRAISRCSAERCSP
jgi:hypothetical protein